MTSNIEHGEQWVAHMLDELLREHALERKGAEQNMLCHREQPSVHKNAYDRQGSGN